MLLTKWIRMTVLGMAAVITLGSVGIAEASSDTKAVSGADVLFTPGDSEGLTPTDPDYPDIEEPVDPRPEDPDDPGPEPIGKDGLYILITPKLDFGAVRIIDRDYNYFSKAQYLYRLNHDDYVFRPQYVEVVDLRGSNAGWSVRVKTVHQFVGEDGTELEGAQIIMRNGWVNSAMDNWTESNVIVEQDIVLDPGDEDLVMKAERGYGAGRWFALFGETEELWDTNSYYKTIIEEIDDHEVLMHFNPSIILSVPGETKKIEQDYHTTLVWTISDTPGN